ncbi:MAG: sulfite exporter TauE/SafE family protein [Sandaracinaceae bacterium]
MIAWAIMAGAAAGLMSAPHCALMCGPLAACGGSAGPRGAVRYQLGRLGAYALAGTAAGTGARFAQELLPTQAIGAVFSWSVAIALLVLAHRLWTSPEGRLVRLGRTRRSSTPVERLMRHAARHPAGLGAMSALLPCGALYAALAVAASSGGPAGGALSMIAFGLVSGSGLAAASWIAARARSLSPRPTLTRGLAVACMVGAIVFAIRPIDAMRRGTDASCHTTSAASEPSAAVTPR